MTTLALLKAEIADDLERSDLTTEIAAEIPRAIRHYQTRRFWFNESRDETFSTVSGQRLYSSSDDAAIPKFITLDQVTLLYGTSLEDLERIQPREWEGLVANGATGRPTCWTYFNRQIGLYVIPDAAYTVRLIGHIMLDAPASDSETGNLWMTEAFDLLRARVCAMLYLRKLRRPDLAQGHRLVEEDELKRMHIESASRIGTGYIIPTEF